mgnify:CR=1 FL=1
MYVSKFGNRCQGKDGKVRRNNPGGVAFGPMSDAVVVIESGERGGALITADIANSYNRDVFALPGRTTDKYSKGCNVLIKTNKAALAESAKDISYIMGWDEIENKVKVKQRDMFFKFSDEEKLIFDTLNVDLPIGIDKIIANVDLPPSKVSSVLLALEFEGVVQSLPGKLYTIYFMDHIRLTGPRRGFISFAITFLTYTKTKSLGY